MALVTKDVTRCSRGSRHRALLEESFARDRVVDDTRELLDELSRLTASRRRAATGRG
jgi:hypothetical protein